MRSTKKDCTIIIAAALEQVNELMWRVPKLKFTVDGIRRLVEDFDRNFFKYFAPECDEDRSYIANTFEECKTEIRKLKSRISEIKVTVEDIHTVLSNEEHQAYW